MHTNNRRTLRARARRNSWQLGCLKLQGDGPAQEDTLFFCALQLHTELTKMHKLEGQQKYVRQQQVKKASVKSKDAAGVSMEEDEI